MRNQFVMTSTKFGPMLINRRDTGVGVSLVENSSYNENDINECFKLIEKRRAEFGDGVVIIDAGANIGVNSINWAKKTFGWANIIAIEPQLPIYYALCGNIVLNNCWNIRPVWAVACHKPHSRTLFPVLDLDLFTNFGGLSLIEEVNTEIGGKVTGYELVPTMTIDQLELPRLDFIKIDVQAMELDVLEGAKITIERCKPIIFIEYNLLANAKELYSEKLPNYRIIDYDDANYIMEPV